MIYKTINPIDLPLPLPLMLFNRHPDSHQSPQHDGNKRSSSYGLDLPDQGEAEMLAHFQRVSISGDDASGVSMSCSMSLTRILQF